MAGVLPGWGSSMIRGPYTGNSGRLVPCPQCVRGAPGLARLGAHIGQVAEAAEPTAPATRGLPPSTLRPLQRNPNGAGTITKRKDGRLQAAVHVLQPDGTRARDFAYGKTWAAWDAKRRGLLDKVDQGVPVPTRSARLSEWLPYWLDNIVKPRRTCTTYAKYEVHVRLYLVPMLGSKRLESLGVADVRRFLVQLERKTTAVTARESHRVLRTALTAASREELVMGNVATLVEPPSVDARDLSPWSLDETLDFLTAARKDPLYAAFVLAIALGFRRGEVVGLRRENLDLERREIRVRTQRQRVRGEAYEDDPKGRRRKQTLPLPVICAAPLRWQRPHRAAHRAAQPVSLVHPRRRLGRPSRHPAARRPARLRHPAHRGRRHPPVTFFVAPQWGLRPSGPA